MSSSSGIPATEDLVAAFAQAEQNNIRFIKSSIKNEQLVLDTSVPISGSFADDLEQLQTLLENNVPAYILARLDGSKEFLFVTYVPDSAAVRDKMLYASTRASLTKSLGSFSDTLFATTKADLTPEAYAAHRRHVTAASPLSAREAEMVALRAAERAAGDDLPRGSAARNAIVHHTEGIAWSDGIEADIKKLGSAGSSKVLVLSIDVAAEKLIKTSYADANVADLPKSIPQSDPSYALFSWHHTVNGEQRHDVVFVYNCPDGSKVKSRMLYSSSIGVLVNQIKALGIPVAKRIETSSGSELDEPYLLSVLGIDASSGTNASATEENRPFARPRGPARKR